MRSYNRSTRMWGVTVAGLCVLWFAAPASAVPLESWDNKIPNATQRFKVLSEFGGAAVLDKETQLVWEQSPLTTSHPWDLSAGRFESATAQCAGRTTGGRKSWRLPSIHELASLLDPTNSDSSRPSLPPGHPFTNVQLGSYWSATTYAANPANAWFVKFYNSTVSDAEKFTTLPVWCVRGGNNADAY